MGGILLVSGPGKGRDYLTAMLCPSAAPLNTVESGGQARRLLVDSSFDLMVINAPLSDEDGRALAADTALSSDTSVILLVCSELADAAAGAEKAGALVLEKPLSRGTFEQAVRLAEATRRRMLGLKNENRLLQNKIEEIRLVDRAKCALIQVLRLTEPQAHRYIERQAMDRRISRREVAEGILRTYENTIG